MKKTVNIIKANIQGVAHQLSHKRAAVHAMVDCLVDDVLLYSRPDHAAIRRRFKSATASTSSKAYLNF